jgi:hypothetical protein
MIDTRTFPVHRLIVHQCSGQLTVDEVAGAGRHHSAQEWCRLVLWDFGDASVAGFSSEHIRRIAEGTSQVADVRRAGKTALVAHTEAQYGMCRMYEIFLGLQESQVRTAIFRSRRAAELWLDGALPPGIGAQGPAG